MPGPFDQGWRRIVVAASGPSFTIEQAAMIEAARVAGRCKVIAVNDTGLPPGPGKSRFACLPNADAIYASDAPWWHANIKEARSLPGQLWTAHEAAAMQYGLHYVNRRLREGLSADLGCVNGGGNSGYAAIGLAYLFTPPPTDEEPVCIALAGFDMQHTGGRIHHHADHGSRPLDKLADPTAAALNSWAERFVKLAKDLEAAGVGVINCTRVTALKCFERLPLEALLG